MMQAELSWATSDVDKEAAYRLRYRVHIEEQGFSVNEADHARQRFEEVADAGSRIVIARLDQQVVGTVRLQWGGEARFSDALREEYDVQRFGGVVEERNIIIASRIMVSPEYRGRGLAVRLLMKVFEFAAAQGVDLILGRCESSLIPYYHKLGFRPFGAPCLHPTNGLRRRIVVLTTDYDHLRRIGSPMLEVLRQRRKTVRPLEELRTLFGARSTTVESTLFPRLSCDVLSRKVPADSQASYYPSLRG